MTRLLFDFTQAAGLRGWGAVDDRVMGGVSRSQLRHDAQGHAVFEGEVSLDRNGGFASVRCSPQDLAWPGATGCLVEVRGQPLKYKLSLFMDSGFNGLSYQAGFTPAAEDWQSLRLAIGSFRPSFRGRDVPGAPALDPARIRQVGLMIADRQAGPFSLAIRQIMLA